jgi:hypothetical protein
MESMTEESLGVTLFSGDLDIETRADRTNNW